MTRRCIALLLLGLVLLAPVRPALAQDPTGANDGLPFNITVGNPSDGEGAKPVSTTIKIVILLTVLSVLPSLILALTSFTRIVIVLSFLRNALNTQSMPPNPILIGLSLFLTMVVMQPVLTKIQADAIVPLLDDKISLGDAGEKAAGHLSGFLLQHTSERDVLLFLGISGTPKPATPQELPFHILVASFVLSELKTAFQMGFIIFIPFLVIDMVIASVLLSMGMFMLPPMIISTPFKILLFILVDGWNLVVGNLVTSFV
jgi:flagellar biosynthetic protein FliP